MPAPNSSEAPTYRSGKKSVQPLDSDLTDAARAGALRFLGVLAAEVSGGVVDLPCFPNVVIHIREALANAHTTPEKTVAIVGAEPRLAAKLIQTANSAAFNPTGKPVTELRSAITRLGHNAVQSAAMAYAVKELKDEDSLRPITQRLKDLWKESITVASIAQVVARSARVSPDEAFLTGLLHGIGSLYILVRAAGKPELLDAPGFVDLVIGWQASIGKAVLENWRFAQAMSDAVGDQTDYGRKRSAAADLTDVLVVSLSMADVLHRPLPRTVETKGINSFQTIGLSEEQCALILTHAEHQLASLQEALGC